MPCSAWTQRGSQPRKDPKAATSTPRHCWPMPLPWQVTRKGEQRYSCHWIRKPWRKVRAHLGTFSHPTFSESRIPHQKSPMTPSEDPFPSLNYIIIFIFCLFFNFWPHYTACGILVPQPEIKPTPLALEGWVLTTGPPRKSLCIIIDLKFLTQVTHPKIKGSICNSKKLGLWRLVLKKYMAQSKCYTSISYWLRYQFSIYAPPSTSVSYHLRVSCSSNWASQATVSYHFKHKTEGSNPTNKF